MIRKFYYFLIFFLTCQITNAQQISTVNGAEASAMGGCSVSFDNFWSVSNNQAGLGFQKQASFGIYSENRYSIRNLNQQVLAGIIPISQGAFGINYSYFGYDKFNQQKIGLAYGRLFGKKLSVGIQLDYLQTNIGDNYGKKGVLTFEGGILVRPTSNLQFGAHVYNPIKAKLSEEYGQNIPTYFRLGVRYKISADLISTVEAENDILNKTVYKAGLEYRIREMVFARIGISNNPALVSFGVGVRLGNFSFDFSSSAHTVLGYSPQFSAIYSIPKKGKK